MTRKCKSVSIPPEVIGMTAMHLVDNPRKILMLSCVSKHITFDEKFWSDVWLKHRIYWKKTKKRPHFYLDYEPTSDKCKTVLKLVYGMFCSMCGCRFHHSVFETYRKRICVNCLRDNHISNNVLYFRYGINLSEIIPCRFFVRFISLKEYLNPDQIVRLSSDELDINFTGKQRLIFFWKPDLLRFFNLEERATCFKNKMNAINLIKACFKRRFLQTIKPRHLVEYAISNEVRRIRKPIGKIDFMAGTNVNLAHVIKEKGKIRVPAVELNSVFRFWPLPLMNDDQFCLRTMGEKLNMNCGESIFQKAYEICRNVPGRNTFEEFGSYVFSKSNI